VRTVSGYFDLHIEVSDNWARVHRFIDNLGFSIYRAERLENFGDYIIEGCSTNFCIRGMSDRLVESLELRSLFDPNNWYDINVVMAYVGNEDKLLEVLDIDTQSRFVENHLDELAHLFSEEAYPHTIERLEELGNKRAKLMFPSWFK
jgi:hypothetical protein